MSLRVLIFDTCNSKECETEKVVYCKHNIILLLWVDFLFYFFFSGRSGLEYNFFALVLLMAIRHTCTVVNKFDVAPH